MNKIQLKLFIVAFILFAFARIASAQTSTFTYQGRLTDASAQANGTYDLGFALFDAASGGTQIGAAVTHPAVNVSNGIFTVQLDFGAGAFSGANRFLEIAVKRRADTNFTTLTPRQTVTSTPYAIRSVSAAAADTATNASNLGGTAANQFVQTADTRLTDARTPTAGSANYVQNQNQAAQTSTNFNIDGTGAANDFNAARQYNIGGNRVLFTDGDGGANTFVGLQTGRINDTGALNVFNGYLAGSENTSGSSNSFVGAQAGQRNSTGTFNAFFKRFAGNRNTLGESNSFFGAESGLNTTTGLANSFFGESAGSGNITGGNNLALGALSGFGSNNLNFATAVGSFAKVGADDTIVIGKIAGNYFGSPRPADAVQIPGTLTVVGAINGTVTNATTATNATQLGGVAASNFVQTSSTQFIRNQTAQQTASNFNISGDGTAGGTISGGTINSGTQYNFGGSRVLGVPNSTSIILGLNAGNALGSGNTDNTFVGARAGVQCQTAVNLGDCLGNTFLGKNAGASSTIGSGNTFVGIDTNNTNPSPNNGGAYNGSNNTLLGARASLLNPDLDHAVAIGADSYAAGSNTIVLGRANGADKVITHGRLDASGSLSAIGGVSLNDSVLRLRDPSDENHLIVYNPNNNGMFFKTFDNYQWFNGRNNRVNMQLDTNGNLAIVGSYNRIFDARYKTDVQTFGNALDTIKRLRGVTYKWIPGFNNPAKQIGFIAQEVEAVLPELVHTDDKGFKSVAYSDAVPVLVEAVKEQNAQIETQNRQIERQQKQIDELKAIVCAMKPDAQICKTENK